MKEGWFDGLPVMTRRMVVANNLKKLLSLHESLHHGEIVLDFWDDEMRDIARKIDELIFRLIAKEASESQLFLDDCITDCGNRGEDPNLVS